MVLPAAGLAVLPPSGAEVLVACSGGADSVALLWALHRLGRWPLTVWHLDHGLRSSAGAEADFVAALAQRLGVPAVVERADIAALARAQGQGLEETGRHERYRRLTVVAQSRGISAVCTAHHRDDDVETVLHHILRGCGPSGLAGIAARRRLAPGIDLLRPLLSVPAAQLRRELAAAGESWCEDASNADPRFTRNRLRCQLLPDFESACPGFIEAFAERIAAAKAERLAAELRLDELWTQAWRHDRLLLAPLAAVDPELRHACWRRLLLDFGAPCTRDSLRRVEDLYAGHPGRRLHLRELHLRRGGRALIVESAAAGSVRVTTVIV